LALPLVANIKPETILLDKDQNAVLARFDFVEACTDEPTLTSKKGTPGYVSPEVGTLGVGSLLA
jgi:serine/threonine protein kinase